MCSHTHTHTHTQIYLYIDTAQMYVVEFFRALGKFFLEGDFFCLPAKSWNPITVSQPLGSQHQWHTMGCPYAYIRRTYKRT